MRIRNLPLLKDVTTGNYIPVELDSFAFLRYAQYILEHGHIMDFDLMRYYPNGYYPANEFSFVSHFIVWLYKFLHMFNSNLTLEYVDAIYPPLAFVVGLIFFFLLVRRLFDWRVALLGSAFLAVIPPYIYRTMAGFSDKEALGMMFFFVSLYLFTASWQTSSLKKSLSLAALSGIMTALMALSWGGVYFVFLTIGLYALYMVVFDYFTPKEYYDYATWCIFSILFSTVVFTTRFTLSGAFNSLLFIPLNLALVVGFFRYLILRYNFFNLQHRFQKFFPLGITTAIISSLLILLLFVSTHGFQSLFYRVQDFITSILTPYAASRWGVTVAESHQPYISDWFSQFGNFYFWTFLIGVLLFVFYTFIVRLKHRLLITSGYVIFLVFFLMSRYSSQPPFDGVSSLARLFYFGSLLFFVAGLLFIYWYSYKHHKELYSQLFSLKKEYIFVFVWLFVQLVTARLAIRLLFVFAPLTAIIVAFLYVKIYDLSRSIPSTFARYAFVLAVVYLLFSPFVSISLVSYYQQDLRTVGYSGPAYTQQWQIAMDWVRKNTPEDAVFAHWWDYGYWVQGGGQRATLTDGGNSGGPALNHFMGRNVITGANSTEALEFLKVKKATHLLIISDEIGKYGAFSSIGSNQTYDRFSVIPTFTLSPSESKEQRDQTLFVYRGSAAFDEDIYFDGQLFPARSSGIAAIMVPISVKDNRTSIQQPRAVVVYQNQQYSIPLKCVFVDRKEIVFPEPGIRACLQIIPAIEGNSVNVLGGGLYLSQKVWNTLFTHMYLFDQKWEGFTLAYTDEQSVPLALYNGRTFGPLKIWSITYPDSIPYNPHYEELELDASLSLV